MSIPVRVIVGRHRSETVSAIAACFFVFVLSVCETVSALWIDRLTESSKIDWISFHSFIQGRF